jgi:hypothetical protein
MNCDLLNTREFFMTMNDFLILTNTLGTGTAKLIINYVFL